MSKLLTMIQKERQTERREEGQEQGHVKHKAHLVDTLDGFWAIGWCSENERHGCKPLHHKTHPFSLSAHAVIIHLWKKNNNGWFITPFQK
jgi:hypothetical protein